MRVHYAPEYDAPEQVFWMARNTGRLVGVNPAINIAGFNGACATKMWRVLLKLRLQCFTQHGASDIDVTPGVLARAAIQKIRYSNPASCVPRFFPCV